MQPESYTSESDQTPKIEQLYGRSYKIDKLSNGDHLPVGGSIFDNELTTKLELDFDKFTEFTKDTQQLAANYDKEKLKEWLVSADIDIDAELFAKLFAFGEMLKTRYPVDSSDTTMRMGLYHQSPNIAPTLSHIFSNGAQECSEITALAQYFLQQESVKSSFLNGEVLWDKTNKWGEPHNFIFINSGTDQYIYDPSNPTSTTQGDFPSIYTTKANFMEEIRRDKQSFVTADNIISKKQAYYGVGDGTNISEHNIV